MSGARLFFFSAALHGVWDLSSPTRDQTRIPCIGSAESQPLDHQGSPDARFYIVLFHLLKGTGLSNR